VKILAVVPIKFDGTSYYRAYGIFPNLKKHFGGNFEVTTYFDGAMGYTWADLLPYDVLFLQRPSLDATKRIKLIDYCQKLGKKVWIDFDDNLFAVPMENRVHDDMKPEVLQAMAQVLQMADLVTVSTPNLKAFYEEKLGLKNVHVVPNAWNFELHGFADKYNEVKEVPPPQIAKIKFLWRGSETHQGDLADAFEAILHAAMEQREKAHWTFMGYNPWMLTEMMPRELWSYVRSEDIMEYFRNLKAQAPQIVFFPLRDNVFNRSKSNICWMEATYAGAVCIAPNWDEWKKPGIISYSSTDDFQNHLTEDYSQYASACWRQSESYIRENLNLNKVNLLRKQLLESL